jgi:ankyrin repeat protein
MTDFGEGITVKNSEGRTPLMYAVHGNKKKSVNFLTA